METNNAMEPVTMEGQTSVREYYLKIYFAKDEKDDEILFRRLLNNIGVLEMTEEEIQAAPGGMNRVFLHGMDQLMAFVQEIEMYPELRTRPWFISNWPNSREYGEWMMELKRRIALNKASAKATEERE